MRVFGYPARQAIGQPITLVIPVDRQSDGSLIVVSLTVSPVKDASGKIVGALKIARDTAEQREITS